MGTETSDRRILVYMIRHHPLDAFGSPESFSWLEFENGYRRHLEGLLGEPIKPEAFEILVDEQPAGPAWRQLLEALIQERVAAVVTHLAPLSGAQRQQLIGVCAQMGARLITPSDAGRNRAGEKPDRIP